MRKVGIIGAMRLEIEAYQDVLEHPKTIEKYGIEFTTGRIGATEVVLAVSGVGKVNAAVVTTVMSLSFHVTELINTGVAGGIGLKTLTTVVATACCQHDIDTTALGDPAGLISGSGFDCVFLETDAKMRGAFFRLIPNAVEGIVATGDAFIADGEKCRAIKENFNAVAVDCESCAILQAAIRLGIPAAVVRAISDGADEKAAMSYQELAAVAAQNAKSAVVRYLAETKEEKL